MIETVGNIFGSLSERMRLTPQDVRWHGEGDVLTHTRMVCEALGGLPQYAELPACQREILMAAAMLHDVGKVAVTRSVAGAIEAPHHAPVGARMARERMWLSGMSGSEELMTLRETVCRLVRHHSFPPHAIDDPDGVPRLHRIAADGLLAAGFSLRLLCILARADMAGRVCGDRAEMLDRISLCAELAADEGCLDSCYPFPSDCTRRAFLSGRDVWKDQTLYDDSWGTVYMMSELPGTGKDTWIARNLPDLPMVSLDEIRRELRYPPTKNQGIIANLGRERAREYLRRRQPFVWNATDITRATRQQLVSLFESYGARVHIIWLETGWQTLLERNAPRPDAVPRPAIEAMLGKLELPEACEAARVDWLCV